MKLALDLQVACPGDNLPEFSQFKCWARAALGEDAKDEAELGIRLVTEQEIQALNSRFRHKDKPTNVLSFPAQLPDELDLPLLGDIAICAAVVEREAETQNKPLLAHWAHMVVHGTLHLLGHDHIEDGEAAVMEALETKILTGLDFPPPYSSNTDHRAH